MVRKTKEILNHSLGNLGVLLNLDTTATLDLSSGKLNFDSPPSGWLYYGLTEAVKMTTDVQVYESKVGVPEFLLKRFLVGVDGTLTGTFIEADLEIHDLIAGDGQIKNIGGLVTPVDIQSVSAVDKKIVILTADLPADFKVGNQLVAAPAASIAASKNSAKITSIVTDAVPTNTNIFFEDGWFRSTPLATDVLQQYKYGIAQLAASELPYVQAVMVYESMEGVQFVYHFPKVAFTPNISPESPTTSSVFKLPFECKAIGVPNSQHFDGNKNIIGYFYELYARS